MKKSLAVILSAVFIIGMLIRVDNNNLINATEESSDIMQNSTYSTIDENGDVTIHEYTDEDNGIKDVQSNRYQVIKKNGDNSSVVNTYETYEEAEMSVFKYQRYRSPVNYEIEVIADTKDITYGTARIIGYVQYVEVDGSGTGRAGYTHGTSANDAAYISTSSDGKTIRVKQAGVYMDIPASNVEVAEYTNDSKVSYYMSKNGTFSHYYYAGSYGDSSKLYSTQVGYTPNYLKDNTKYYSYDGHYFYTDYKTMLNDYRSGFSNYTQAVNASEPYYNYYQYLSFRSTTSFSATDLDKIITDKKGENTDSKLKDQGQALLNNEKQYGINAALMLGVSINESAWGLSKYSQDRNNLFGIGAVDSNPDAALRFNTVEECFNYFAYNTISAGYLNCVNYRYRGPHLGDKQSGVNVKYASDPYWGEKAASFSYMLNQNTENKDYQKYQLAIAKTGKINFYDNETMKNDIYNSAASDSTNENVYNFPVTILSEGSNAYKILSDTVLNSTRNNFDVKGYFDITRDYVFIKKSDVNIVGKVVTETFLTGDVNGDGKIDSMDMYFVTQHILGKSLLSGTHFKAADTNSDNKIDSMDMYNIIQIILKA